MYIPIVSNAKNNRWFGYSPRLKRDVILESDLEYDHWVLVETDPLVRIFCEHPLRIYRVINGKKKYNIFDMWINQRCGRELFVEVKYSYQLDPTHPRKDERSIQQVYNMREWCKYSGNEFEVRTEKEIRSNLTYLSNMKQLLPSLRHTGSPIETDQQLLLRLVRQGPTKLAEIFKRLPGIPNYRILGALGWLHIAGILKSNFAYVVLGDNSEVYIDGYEEEI